jgi:hypothetical protein
VLTVCSTTAMANKGEGISAPLDIGKKKKNRKKTGNMSSTENNN